MLINMRKILPDQNKKKDIAINNIIVIVKKAMLMLAPSKKATVKVIAKTKIF